MIAKLVAGFLGLIIVAVLLQGFVLGGGDGGGSLPSVSRPGSIPTATPPAQLPEPVQLGQAPGGTTGATGGATGPGQAAGRQTYVVQSGDTLGSIASQFNVSPEQQGAWVGEVLRLNNMDDARQLRAGQELNIPPTTASAAGATGTPARTTTPAAGASPTATPSTQASPTATPRPAGSGGTYTVVSGDIPLTIAAKFCVDNPTAWANQLVEINGVSAGSLRVGQELTLPPGTPAPC